MVLPEATEQPAINALSIIGKSNQHSQNQSVIARHSKSFVNMPCSSLWLSVILGLFMFIVMCCSYTSAVNITLGPLYDCFRVYHTAIYKFTDHAQCQHNMHLSESKVKYFHANVLQYSPRSSHLTIYHCIAERLEMTCHETFFGHKSKHRSLHTIPVTVHDCTRAMRHHVTQYGRLKKHNHAERKTHTPDSYSCKWMHTRKRIYTHFKMIAYPARLHGNNKYIQQHLTHTHCRYLTMHCRPREMKKSQIVWHLIKHDTRLYHSLGEFKVHQLDNYILVPSLSISGTIMSTRKNSAVFILDNRYVLVRLEFTNGTLHHVEGYIQKLQSMGYIFYRQNKLDVEDNRFQHYLLITDLLVAHVAALLEHERTNVIRAWENICYERQKLSHIYKWAIENFPHSSSKWLIQSPDMLFAQTATHIY